MQFRGKCIDQLYSPEFLIENKEITKRLKPKYKILLKYRKDMNYE